MRAQSTSATEAHGGRLPAIPCLDTLVEATAR